MWSGLESLFVGFLQAFVVRAFESDQFIRRHVFYVVFVSKHQNNRGVKIVWYFSSLVAQNACSVRPFAEEVGSASFIALILPSSATVAPWAIDEISFHTAITYLFVPCMIMFRILTTSMKSGYPLAVISR